MRVTMYAFAVRGLCTRCYSLLSAATATVAAVVVDIAVAVAVVAACSTKIAGIATAAAALTHYWLRINVLMLVLVTHKTGAKTFRLGSHCCC